MRYVIIGNGAAGITAARVITRQSSMAEVTIYSCEKHPAYCRPLIPAVVENSDSSAAYPLFDGPLERVEEKLGVEVSAIDPDEHRLSLSTGTPVVYDKLLIATGASAILPSLPGLKGGGVFVLRTLDDARLLLSACREHCRVAIIGGGRVGTKAAVALNARGLKVTIIEKLDWIVPHQFDEVAGQMLTEAIRAQGIVIELGHSPIEIVRSGDGAISGVALDDGRELPADLVLVTVGVEPNVELARKVGLSIEQGLIVDDHLRTSREDIYAAGDAVVIEDIPTGEKIASGLWTNAVEMGCVAGKNMTGEPATYRGGWSILNSMELVSIPTISIGLVNPRNREAFKIHTERRNGRYRKLVLREGVLVGALLIGHIEGAGVYTGLIKRGIEVENRIDALLSRIPTIAPWMVAP